MCPTDCPDSVRCLTLLKFPLPFISRFQKGGVDPPDALWPFRPERWVSFSNRGSISCALWAFTRHHSKHMFMKLESKNWFLIGTFISVKLNQHHQFSVVTLQVTLERKVRTTTTHILWKFSWKPYSKTNWFLAGQTGAGRSHNRGDAAFWLVFWYARSHCICLTSHRPCFCAPIQYKAPLRVYSLCYWS